MVLEAAKEDGIIAMNPARSTRLANPSQKVKKRVALTTEQIDDIIAHLDKLTLRDRMFLALLLFTGMRRNEVLGLKWEDIDFNSGMIHVRRGVTFKGNQPVVSTPKTEAGIRTIPLNPLLAEYLHPRKAKGYVIEDEKGLPLTQQIVKRMWWRIAKTIDGYDTTPHYFRHTFVTFARRAGIEEKTLQTIGGYADIATMQKVYSHVQAEDMQDASEKMVSMYD